MVNVIKEIDPLTAIVTATWTSLLILQCCFCLTSLSAILILGESSVWSKCYFCYYYGTMPSCGPVGHL